jgi:hypothetical protein
MPIKKSDMPSTLARSAEKVQKAYLDTLESAEEPTAAGVDASKTKDELLEDARAADIAGRSKMTKDELVEALQQHSRRETAEARG